MDYCKRNCAGEKLRQRIKKELLRLSCLKGPSSGQSFTGTDSSITYPFTYNPNVEIPTADLHTHPPKWVFCTFSQGYLQFN